MTDLPVLPPAGSNIQLVCLEQVGGQTRFED
jgi:hypothetical protein